MYNEYICVCVNGYRMATHSAASVCVCAYDVIFKRKFATKCFVSGTKATTE